jgi:pimeloyl-ACP methyl ester carboxylesterase
MDEVRFDTTIQNGIERVDCLPVSPSNRPPILFLHGMWHGAWCWREWQALFAGWGWESRSISLPGHGASPPRKSVRFNTMQDYLAVLDEAIADFDAPPILVGHSMGGALAQWRLKRSAPDPPAVVFLASWTSHSTFADGTSLHLRRDPWGFLAMGFTWSTRPLIRSPKRAASMLITEGAVISPEDLHARLCDESYLVLSQHNPPQWSPKREVISPMLWVAGEKDAVVSLKGARKSAAYYGADLMIAPNAGHNLMMEANNVDTARRIEAWLSDRWPGRARRLA